MSDSQSSTSIQKVTKMEHASYSPPRTRAYVRRQQQQQSASPDFSQLPVMIWDDIIGMLGHRDRIALAGTCTTLRAFCEHPRFWRKLVLALGNRHQHRVVCSDPRLPPVERFVLTKYSRYVTTLVLYIYDCLEDVIFSEEDVRILSEASQQWKLNCVHIHPTQTQHKLLSPMSESAKTLLSNLLSLPQLKTLQKLTIFWCRRFEETKKSVLFERLMTPLLGKDLERLSLYSPDEQPWALPLRHEAASFVGQLSALQSLYIHSEFLSDKLLTVLCQLRGLKLLTIEYTLWMVYESRVPLRTSEQNWSALIQAHRDMVVHLSFIVESSSRCDPLLQFVPPPVAPVTNFEIVDFHFQWCREEFDKITNALTTKYWKTILHYHVGANTKVQKEPTHSPCLSTVCYPMQKYWWTHTPSSAEVFRDRECRTSFKRHGLEECEPCEQRNDPCASHQQTLGRLCQKINRLSMKKIHVPVPVTQQTDPCRQTWVSSTVGEPYVPKDPVWRPLRLKFTDRLF